jgi:tetratricopeptide (TPR) repeat protein
MNNTWSLILFGVIAAYFGGKVLQIAPTFFRLLAALAMGKARWPGPRIHNLDRHPSVVRERLGVGYENLFSTFIFNSSGAFGALVFSLLTFLSSTSLMSDYVRINWTWTVIILTLFALIGGGLAAKNAQRSMVQVTAILSDLASTVEPRSVDGRSAESKYAIEHPLIRYRHPTPERRRALELFYESTMHHRDGNEQRALILYQEAVGVDSSLHEHAREALSKMLQDCRPREAGPVYYWLGIHSEWLSDWKQAAASYEKAIEAFSQIGYRRRASRACNNLGNVRMKLRDASALETFEKAIALDPENGTAHINIGTTYYRISHRGDPRFEKAMDAFANAIAADSLTYTPIVTSRLRSIGYTWKEDLADVLQRVDRKMLGTDPEAARTAKKPDESKTKRGDRINLEADAPVAEMVKSKTYRDPEHGFEIDIPEQWAIYKEVAPALASALLKLGHGWDPTTDVAFTGGPGEIVNVVVETMSPEPPPNLTERTFRLYAQAMSFTHCEYGRIIVGNKAHTWARYLVKNRMWSKKYMIVLDGKGYAITASCDDREMFLRREEVWDAIAASLRVPHSVVQRHAAQNASGS